MGHGIMNNAWTMQTHAGGSWAMMDPGWQNANGSYGIVFPFRTR
jgi:hypothetical protein